MLHHAYKTERPRHISIASLSNSALNFLGGTTFAGSIYVPNSDVTMSGNSSSQCMQIIANTIKFTGNLTVNDSCPNLTKQIIGGTATLIH